MKLRIRGNRARSRLSQTEMVQFVTRDTVRNSVEFGPMGGWIYRLAARPEGAEAQHLSKLR